MKKYDGLCVLLVPQAFNMSVRRNQYHKKKNLSHVFTCHYSKYFVSEAGGDRHEAPHRTYALTTSGVRTDCDFTQF